MSLFLFLSHRRENWSLTFHLELTPCGRLTCRLRPPSTFGFKWPPLELPPTAVTIQGDSFCGRTTCTSQRIYRRQFSLLVSPYEIRRSCDLYWIYYVFNLALWSMIELFGTIESNNFYRSWSSFATVRWSSISLNLHTRPQIALLSFARETSVLSDQSSRNSIRISRVIQTRVIGMFIFVILLPITVSFIFETCRLHRSDLVTFVGCYRSSFFSGGFLEFISDLNGVRRSKVSASDHQIPVLNLHRWSLHWRRSWSWGMVLLVLFVSTVWSLRNGLFWSVQHNRWSDPETKWTGSRHHCGERQLYCY